MRTKYNSSYSSVDDRFDFSRKGVFRCRIDSEVLLVIISTAVLLVGEFALLCVVRTNVSINNVLSFSLFGLLAEAGIFILPFIFIGVVKTIFSGETYSFTADERKMLITCPRHDFRADIYYEDVQSVTYNDLMLLGKLRGYSVDIVCGSDSYKFDFLFPYKATRKNKEMTPFVIIEERSGLLEKPEFFMGRRIDDDYFR